MKNVEMVPLRTLVPDHRNARKHNDRNIEEIKRSLRDFGQHRPFVVQRKTNRVIIGNGMLEAALELGRTEGLVLWVDDDDATATRRALADNRTAELAEWDDNILSDLLRSLGDVPNVPGWDDDEIQRLLGDTAEIGGMADVDDIPEVPEPRTKRGDLWTIGKHRLLCGDSTDGGTIMRLMHGELADLILTDPPYNVAYTGKTQDALTIQNDAMAENEFMAFLGKAFSAADSVMRPGAVFYIWHPDISGLTVRLACATAGWRVRQCLIWNKNSMVLGQQDYHWQHESCLYGWKSGAAHLWANDRKQVTVLNFDRPTRNKEHPTMKPVALFEYLLLNNTKSGDIVLDPFVGSGTTVIACENHGRRARVVELDPVYCDVILTRWETYTGQTAVLSAG